MQRIKKWPPLVEGCVAEYEFARANGLEVIDIKEIALNDEVIDLTENKMEVR